MAETDTLVIDCYPWAVPTEEQKRMFDALPPEEQLRMLREAIEEGMNSGVSEKTIDEIIAEARAEIRRGM